MEKETQDKWVVYQRCYDNPKRENGKQKRNLLLGIFEPFKIIHDDTYTSLRYGIKDGSLYRIDEFEVSGYDGGSKFEVTPITTCEDVKVYCEWQSMQKGLTMTQEQKPFEIKEWDVIPENQEPAYVSDANAEIRRLQQQLADAPSWGEWKDATVKNLVAVNIGIYEFETNDGVTFLASKRHDNVSSSSWVLMDGQLRNACDFELNPRFRRLNYEPKPAREVEKKYELYLGDGRYESLTTTELADDAVCDDDLAELARDLLAAQAELRELKGE